MGSTGTGFKTLMGNCIFVYWTSDTSQVLAEVTPSLRCQQFKDVPWSHPHSPTSPRQPQLLGETTAEEMLQNRASVCEIRLQSG